MDSVTVEKAAIYFEGAVYSVERPGRHHNVMDLMIEKGVCERVDSNAEQGFLLSDGRFARRKAALHKAIRSGQIDIDDVTPQMNRFGLFSEDLW